MFYDPFHVLKAVSTRGTPSRAFQRAFRTFNAGESIMATEKITIVGKKKSRRSKRQFTHCPRRRKTLKSEESTDAAPPLQNLPAQATERKEPADSAEPTARENTGEYVETDLPALCNIEFDLGEDENFDAFFKDTGGQMEDGTASFNDDYEVDFHGPLLPWDGELLSEGEGIL
jgi:hypothetical protein